MRGPYFRELKNTAEMAEFMQQIGCQTQGQALMLPKSEIIPLWLKEVKSPAANILKQQMLSLGGEAVVARGVVDCSQKSSDVLLLGTKKEYTCLSQKLEGQPWGLETLGKRIQAFFKQREKRGPLTWAWPDRKLELGQKTLVMGILNVTPDSFSDGGAFLEPARALEHAWQMVEAGADIIDLGGESTRPGFQPLTVAEELRRLEPVLDRLLAELPIPLSVDTYKAAVAEKVLAGGAHLINDVGGGLLDPALPEVVARFQVPVIIMHHQVVGLYQDLLPDFVDCLTWQVQIYETAGVSPEKIVVDPGIGFGKNYQENLAILKNLSILQSCGKPILLGVSRKAFLGETLGLPVGERLEGSLAAAAWGLSQGVSLLRVHDVRETVRLVQVWEALQRGGK